MKRWAKAWLAVGVGCCVCGTALTGIGVASGGSKYVKSADLNKMDGAAKKSDNEMVLKKTKLDDFDSADISMTDMNLQSVLLYFLSGIRSEKGSDQLSGKGW